MQTHLAMLLSDFSVVTALLFVCSKLLKSGLKGLDTATVSGAVLLIALVVLQITHRLFLQSQLETVSYPLYKIALFAVAPAFYCYSCSFFTLQSETKLRQLGHFFPVLIAAFLSLNNALSLAFLVGSAYVLWLAVQVYQLRQQRQRFKLELIALSSLFFIALLVLVLVVLRFNFSEKTFFSLYASLIGGAFFIVLLAQLQFPLWSEELTEVVRLAYSESTLTAVDCELALKNLSQLMNVEKIYRQENLNLMQLAELLGLNSHQLSELINIRLQKGFSKFLREHRIAEARQLLINEPTASVLSIGLSVGFNSQSNFYAAFREIEGIAPGQYRKINATAHSETP